MPGVLTKALRGQHLAEVTAIGTTGAPQAMASRVPPDWHGWLHHTYAEPPTRAPLKARSFEKPHQPNLTGTDGAYRPDGSLAKGGIRPPATGDYQAWKPD